jgi:hypothetical protein
MIIFIDNSEKICKYSSQSQRLIPHLHGQVILNRQSEVRMLLLANASSLTLEVRALAIAETASVCHFTRFWGWQRRPGFELGTRAIRRRELTPMQWWPWSLFSISQQVMVEQTKVWQPLYCLYWQWEVCHSEVDFTLKHRTRVNPK